MIYQDNMEYEQIGYEGYLEDLIKGNYCIDCQGYGQDCGSGASCPDCLGTGKYLIAQKVEEMKAFK